METTQRHKTADGMRILGIDGVGIAGSTPTSTKTPNVAEDPDINRITPSTALHSKTIRLAPHHLDFRIHPSIPEHAAPVAHFSQALDGSCHLKREGFSSLLRIIHSTEASCGGRLQATEWPTEAKIPPLIPTRFTLSSPLRLRTRANGPTIIITNNGVTTATEATITGETGKGHETGDGTHSRGI